MKSLHYRGHQRHYLGLLLVFTLVSFAGALAISLTNFRLPGSLAGKKLAILEAKKDAWGDMLACHPFYTRPPMSEAEWKGIPKKDRPDLAAELDFLRTMDPATGQVPYDRLYKANLEVEERLSRRGPISNVTWEERGPNNIGGRSRLLMFDPNATPNYAKVWAGGVGGGLWYTNDITAATPVWNKVNDFWDNIAVTTMASGHPNQSTYYVGTGEGWASWGAQSGTGIWKSTDGGTTWSVLPNTVPGAYNSGSHFHYIQKIVAKSSAVFAATRGAYVNSGGIMRSTDGGNNWTLVLSVYNGTGSLYDRAADIEIAANGDLFASFGINSQGKVYKSLSASNGASGTWVDLSALIGMGNAERVELACAPSNANVIYAIAEGGSGNNDIEWIKRSTDGGATWVSRTIPKLVDDNTTHFTRGQAFHNLKLEVSVTNSDVVIAGGIDLHRSTDGGLTWTPISHNTGGYNQPEVHADQHAMAFRPSFNNEMVFTHDGGISYSSNVGNTSVTPSFSHKNNGYNVTQFYSVATKNEFNSRYFMGGTQDNGTLRITQPQTAPAVEVTGGDGGFCHIDQNDPVLQYTSYVYNNIFASWNGGISFVQFLADNSGHFINPSEFDNDRKRLYSAAGDNTLKRMSGDPFIPANFSNTNLVIDFGNSKISALKMSPVNDVLIAGIANGRVYRISNASTTPTATRIDNGTSAGWVSSIDIGANDDQILITYSNYGVTSVWETTNGGVNWYNKEGDLPDIPVHWGLYNPDNRNQVLVATEVGVWSTDNFQQGTNGVPDWGPSNANLAHTRCNMLKYRESDKMVVLATYGRGIFTSDIFTAGSVADFSCDQYSSCTGSLTVQFYDASIKPNGWWAWDVDNNGFYDYFTKNPVHTYTSPGTYSVKLTVNNNNTTTTKEHLIVVSSTTPVPHTGCTFSSNDNPGNGSLVGLYSFKLENINNITSYNDGNQDYTCSHSTGLDISTTYNVTVRTGAVYAEGVRVYIDYNNNGVFESTESAIQFPAVTGLRTLSFTTPSDVVAGEPLRLRVLSKPFSIPGNACDIGSHGQAEDYTVMFKCQLLVDQASGTGVGTMSDCISCADDGDTIRISSTLANQTVDVGPLIVSLGKNLVILAEGANTTVTGGGDFVFIIQSGKTVVMDGFNVKATTSTTMSSGMLNYGNLTFNNMNMFTNPMFAGTFLLTNANGGQLTIDGNCNLEN